MATLIYSLLGGSIDIVIFCMYFLLCKIKFVTNNMALNKYMHPRNIYKVPPDFEKLSKLYQEFSNIAKMDVTGKVTIDFKDPHSLRVLTKCLLKHDFNLDVEIPEDRLVPTLPLRLNYILWIEDLMAAVQRDSGIQGIDIGTGACAVYPLLAAVKNKWHMVATEVDSSSFQKAQENILRNNLQELIELKDNKGSKLLESLFTEDNVQKFDFCMCNPPFYSNLQELLESRSPARLPPKNGFTGSPQELITEGGELKFCRKLLNESKRCKDYVLMFTTMVGHKYNLSELLQDLKTEGIKHTHTEFCQGRVTRWGLAWTYQNYDIYHLVPPRDKLRKKHVPISLQLPQISNCEHNMETAYNKIKAMLSGLHIEQQILNKCGNRITLDILARENTWSNQRRKRRLMKRMKVTDSKKLKLDGSTNGKAEETNLDTKDTKIITSHGDGPTNDETNKSNPETADGKMLKIDKIGPTNDEITEDNKDLTDAEVFKSDTDGSINNESNKSGSGTTDDNIKSNEDRPSNDETSKSTIHTKLMVSDNKTNNCMAHKFKENILLDTKLPQKTRSTKEIEPLVHAIMKLYKKDEIIQLEVEFLNGTGGKESVHQVVQYIKNNWK